MAHIKLPDGLPGIRGLLTYSPATAKPIGELAEVLLQCAGLGGVAPVERRKGGEGVGHGVTILSRAPGAASRPGPRCYTRRPSLRLRSA